MIQKNSAFYLLRPDCGWSLYGEHTKFAHFKPTLFLRILCKITDSDV